MKKKATKKLVIAAACAAAVVIAVLCAVLIPKLAAPHAGAYAKEFAAVRADYDKACAYLKSLTAKDADAPLTLSFGTIGANEDKLFCFRDDGRENVKTLTPKEDVMESLDSVAASFARMGFELQTMRVENGVVSFNAADGSYAVLYCESGKRPQTETGHLRKLDALWYQNIA